MNRPARYWLATHHVGSAEEWAPPTDLPERVTFYYGQLERGGQSGALHWQLAIGFNAALKRVGAATAAGLPRSAHLEPTRSAAANEYVLKDDTAVNGTRFRLGAPSAGAGKRRGGGDYKAVIEAAKSGGFAAAAEVDPQIALKCCFAINWIRGDQCPVARGPQICNVYWGVADGGKTHRAKAEALELAGGDWSKIFLKDPGSKWWCGYKGQPYIIVEEFKGGWTLTDFKRWVEPSGMPCRGEVKGGSVALATTHWWITANDDPYVWYDFEKHKSDFDAFRRRLTTVVKFSKKWNE